MAAQMMMMGGRTQSTRMVRRISDINVTPFVDVMLVLLVVFMIAAPLISTTVPVKLPFVEAKPITDQEERLAVTLDHEGKLFLMDTPLEPEALVARLKAIGDANKDSRLSLRADTEQRYGAVLDLMDQLRGAGYVKIDLIFDPMDAALSAQRARAAAAGTKP